MIQNRRFLRTVLLKTNEPRREAADCQKIDFDRDDRLRPLTFLIKQSIYCKEEIPGRVNALASGVAAQRTEIQAKLGSGRAMFKRRVEELVGKPAFLPVESTAAAAAETLVAAKSRCLAVVSGRRVVGFVTARTLCRGLDVNLDASTPVGEILIRDVTSVPQTMLVDEAAKIMLDRQVRHLVVVGADGVLRGLVTDKDFVEALAVDFMVDNVTCQELVRGQTATLPPEASLRETLAVMREKDADAVVAVSGDRPVGIFTESDALSRLFGHPEQLAEPLARHMTVPVVSVPTSAMVYKVILFMRQRGVRRVALLAPDGTLAGLIGQQHILAYVRRMQ